jgi:peptidyl-prolyl cis-trans isomerase A (cyclophilin A)
MTKRILSKVALVTLMVALPLVASAGPRVTIETNKGNIVVELNAETTPITVRNFLSYVESGFYSGTIFHRVISGFMIQGGGFTADLQKKPTRAPIALEAGKGLSNERGTIAMARTSVRDSATSQFFINHRDNAQLDRMGGGYAVFGHVVSGMEVVDAIAAIPTARRGGQANLPTETVTIIRVTVQAAAAPAPTPAPATPPAQP